VSIEVHVPVRVRVDADALSRPEFAVQPPVERALARALESSREAVLVTRRGRVALQVDPPRFRWVGAGVEQVPEDLRRRAERAIEASLRETARTHGVHNNRLGRRTRRPRGPYSRFPEVPITARLRSILEWFGTLDPSGSARGNLTLYREQLEDEVHGAACLVRANQVLLVDELAAAVGGELRRPGRGRVWVWGYTTSARNLEGLGDAVGIRNIGTRLGVFPPGDRGVVGFGRAAAMVPGAVMLFVAVAPREVAVWRMVQIQWGKGFELPLREAGFIARAEFAQLADGAAWEEYVAIAGDTPAQFEVSMFVVRERIHSSVVAVTQRREVVIPPQGGFAFQATRLITRSALAWLPTPLRLEAQPYATAASLDLDPAADDGYWEPGWAGMGVSVVIPVLEDKLAFARARPIARRAAEDVRRLLRGDPDELMWPTRMRNFLQGSFGGGRARNSLALELFFEILEQRGQLVRLVDMIEQTGDYELVLLFVHLASETRYAANERVRRSIQRLQAWTVRNRRHGYDVARQRFLLNGDPEYAVVAGVHGRPVWAEEVIASVDSFMLGRKHERRLTPAAIERIKAQLEGAQNDVLHELLAGPPDARILPKDLGERVLAVALERAHVTDEDVPEVLVETSVRLLKLAPYQVGVVERINVTYEFVERIDGGSWSAIQNGMRTVDTSELEEMLTLWRIGESGRYLSYISMGVTVAALVVVAWEVGVIGWLVSAGGGGWAVGISIGISELIFLYKVIKGDAAFTLEGFLMAALDGYLMAVGFRLAAPLGRIAGRGWATGTSPSASKAFLAERFVVGAVGGGTSAAMMTFSHDLVNIALGRQQGFSPFYVWARNMSFGMALGVVAELGLAGGQAAARVAFPTTTRTLGEAVAAIRAARIAGDKWALMTLRAVRRMSETLSRDLEEHIVAAVTRGFRERSREIVDALLQSADDMVLRRLIELGERELSEAGILGLERTLAAARARMSEAEVRALVERIAGLQREAVPFLDFLGRLDASSFEQLMQHGQLRALVGAPRARQLIGSMTPDRSMILLDRFRGQVAELEQFATRVSARPQAEQAAIYRTFFEENVRQIRPRTLITAVERLGGLTDDLVTRLRSMSASGSIGHDLTSRLVHSLPPAQLRSVIALSEAASVGQFQRLGRLGFLERAGEWPNVVRLTNTNTRMTNLLRVLDAGGAEGLARYEAALATTTLSGQALGRFTTRFAETLEQEAAALSAPRPLSVPAGTAADALAPLAGGAGTNTARALRVLREGGANELLSALETIARTKPDVVQRILDGIGRHFRAGSQADFRSMVQFLQAGGSTEALATVLAYSRAYGHLSAARAVRQLATLSQAELRGMDELIRFLGGGERATDRVIGIATNYSEPGSVFRTFAELMPATSAGLEHVMAYAGSASQNLNQAALGALRAGREILARHPGARLRFEVEAQAGGFLRVSDIIVTLPPGARAGYLRVEIKEVADFSVLEMGHSVRQFARDVHLELQTPVPAGLHRLARMRWMIRRPAHDNGVLKTDSELVQDLERIRNNLRDAFNDSVIGPVALRRALRAEFDAHVAEIVQFF
jgi:hypothetical protein